MVPVSISVCSIPENTDLITELQAENQSYEASGWISAPVCQPLFMNMFHESWIEHHHQVFVTDHPWLHWTGLLWIELLEEPRKILCLVWKKHKKSGVCQVLGTLWIHDMISCLGPDIFLVAFGTAMVHSYYNVVKVNQRSIT